MAKTYHVRDGRDALHIVAAESAEEAARLVEQRLREHQRHPNGDPGYPIYPLTVSAADDDDAPATADGGEERVARGNVATGDRTDIKKAARGG